MFRMGRAYAPEERIEIVETTHDMVTTDIITDLVTGPDIDHDMHWEMDLVRAMDMDTATILTTTIAATVIVPGSGQRSVVCQRGSVITA